MSKERIQLLIFHDIVPHRESPRRKSPRVASAPSGHVVDPDRPRASSPLCQQNPKALGLIMQNQAQRTFPLETLSSRRDPVPALLLGSEVELPGRDQVLHERRIRPGTLREEVHVLPLRRQVTHGHDLPETESLPQPRQVAEKALLQARDFVPQEEGTYRIPIGQ